MQLLPFNTVPGLHAKQPVKSDVEALPAGHDVQMLTEPRLNLPSSQATHPILESFTRVPAPQVRQLDASAALYELSVHVEHVDVPPTEKVPATQLLH